VITKILIANRGEIAVRIVRACAEMGIRSVAIYSDADRHALHVKRADEAHSIGAEPLAGYLNPRKLVNLAVETGCDALHPGYGFLSENAELADICAERGIKFIGPSAEVIRRMGDKTEARRSMIKAGVPVTPGTEGNVSGIEEALTEGDRIGYPVAVAAFVAATAAKNSNRLSHVSFPKPPRRSVRRKCSWKNASSIRSTSKHRFLATASATWCTCSSVTARSSAATRS
jgi:acetyl/propionyl-CoA carboxylase alpha subunit